jgi:hypothetical protein
MSNHTPPPVPPANRSTKGPADSKSRVSTDTTHKHDEPPHDSEQGDTANVKQNTTNKGGVHGNRLK